MWLCSVSFPYFFSLLSFVLNGICEMCHTREYSTLAMGLARIRVRIFVLNPVKLSMQFSLCNSIIVNILILIFLLCLVYALFFYIIDSNSADFSINLNSLQRIVFFRLANIVKKSCKNRSIINRDINCSLRSFQWLFFPLWLATSVFFLFVLHKHIQNSHINIFRNKWTKELKKLSVVLTLLKNALRFSNTTDTEI